MNIVTCTGLPAHRWKLNGVLPVLYKIVRSKTVYYKSMYYKTDRSWSAKSVTNAQILNTLDSREILIYPCISLARALFK